MVTSSSKLLDVLRVFDPIDGGETYCSRLDLIWQRMPTTQTLATSNPFTSDYAVNGTIESAMRDIVAFLRVKTLLWVRSYDSSNDDDGWQPQRRVIRESQLAMSLLDALHTLEDAGCNNKNHRETLLEHLVFTMTWCLFLMRYSTKREQIAFGLMGLLHDIGKKASQVVSRGYNHYPPQTYSTALSTSSRLNTVVGNDTVTDANVSDTIATTDTTCGGGSGGAATSNRTSFMTYPYHGEISCTICYAFYSRHHEPYVSRNTWDDVCQSIRVHMCGYHCTGESIDHLMKWNFLRTESPETRSFLPILSVADVYARVSNSIEDFGHFFDTRSILDDYLNMTFDVSFARTCIPTRSPSMRRGLLVMLRSITTCEKNMILRRLVETLEQQRVKFRVITRDDFIVDLAMQLDRRDTDTNKAPNSNGRRVSESMANRIRSYYPRQTATTWERKGSRLQRLPYKSSNVSLLAVSDDEPFDSRRDSTVMTVNHGKNDDKTSPQKMNPVTALERLRKANERYSFYRRTDVRDLTDDEVMRLFTLYSPNNATRYDHSRISNQAIRKCMSDGLSLGEVVIYDDSSMVFSCSSECIATEALNVFKIAIDVRSCGHSIQSTRAAKYGDTQRQLNSMHSQGWELMPSNTSSTFNSLRSCMSALTVQTGLEKVNTSHLVYPVVFNSETTPWERVLTATADSTTCLDSMVPGLSAALRGVQVGLKVGDPVPAA